jgi:hypothetical protein
MDEDPADFAFRQLKEDMDLSDPDIVGCEYDRLTLAQQAVQHFWNLYRYRMNWAGDFILGRLLYRDQVGLRRALEPLLDRSREDDDYFFEEIGSLFGWNGRKGCLHESAVKKAASESYERGEWDYRDDIQRQFFIEMTMTTVGDATWAKDAQTAFFEVNVGGHPRLFQPSKKVHGDAGLLHHAKFMAVAHVRALAASGTTKLMARLEVGTILGASEATLKAWEGELEKDEYTSFQLHCCDLIGVYGEALETATHAELEEAATARFWSDSDTNLAKHLRSMLRNNPLEEVRDSLRAARSG